MLNELNVEQAKILRRNIAHAIMKEQDRLLAEGFSIEIVLLEIITALFSWLRFTFQKNLSLGKQADKAFLKAAKGAVEFDV